MSKKTKPPAPKRWCGACDRFSGHRARECPRRPLAYRIKVIAWGPRVPVGEP